RGGETPWPKRNWPSQITGKGSSRDSRITSSSAGSYPARRKARSYRGSRAILGLDFLEFGLNRALDHLALLSQMPQGTISSHPPWSSLPIARGRSHVKPGFQGLGEQLFKRYSFLCRHALGAA